MSRRQVTRLLRPLVVEGKREKEDEIRMRKTKKKMK